MPDPIVTLDEARAWLRVDLLDEDVLIQTLIGAASEWARGAADLWDGTGPAPERVRLAALTLIADWFDTRGASSDGKGVVAPLPHGPAFLIGQLRTVEV